MNKKNKGFILVTTLLIIAILIVIAIPYISRVASEYKLVSKMNNLTLALDLAEAGIERAIWEICYNSSTFSGWAYVNGANGQTWTISNVPFKNVSGSTVGYYDVNVLLPAGLTTSTITSTGYVPTKQSPDETRKVTITYAGGQYHFTNAIAAAGPHPSVTMSGQAKTDSYDSAVGPYGSPLQTQTTQGNVESNGPITMSGQSYIHGNANPGPGYPFSGTPPVSGSYGTLSAPITVNPIPVSTLNAAKVTNNNTGITIAQGNNITNFSGTNFSISGQQTATIPGGTYYFTAISISGQGKVNVTGPAVIYVDGGDVSISGQGIVNNGPATNLGIYTTGSSVSLSGQAAYVGTVYAPTASVTLTGQENLYGAIVCGSSVDTGQAAIHFDIALSRATQSPNNNRATSWIEQ